MQLFSFRSVRICDPLPLPSEIVPLLNPSSNAPPQAPACSVLENPFCRRLRLGVQRATIKSESGMISSGEGFLQVATQNDSIHTTALSRPLPRPTSPRGPEGRGNLRIDGRLKTARPRSGPRGARLLVRDWCRHQCLPGGSSFSEGRSGVACRDGPDVCSENCRPPVFSRRLSPPPKFSPRCRHENGLSISQARRQ